MSSIDLAIVLSNWSLDPMPKPDDMKKPRVALFRNNPLKHFVFILIIELKKETRLKRSPQILVLEV